MQKNYSNDKIPKPIKRIEDKIDNESEKNSNRIRPYLIKSNSYSNIIRQKIIENYKETERNKEILENELESNNESIDKDKNKKNVVRDYLQERRKLKELKKERKKSEVGVSTRDYIGLNEVKNIIKEKGMDNNTFKFVKSKLQSIEEKTKQKNMLLKFSGGVANKPELGDEICDLMINSIKAKLSLIKEMDKNLDDSFVEEDDENKEDNNDINKDKEQSGIQEKTEENSIENN